MTVVRYLVMLLIMSLLLLVAGELSWSALLLCVGVAVVTDFLRWSLR